MFSRNHAAQQGLWGEQIAEQFLIREKGLKLLGRRIKVGKDEIDLLFSDTSSRQGSQLVFVEVKTRSSQQFGGGSAAVDVRKRHALCRAAVRLLKKFPPAPFRIDLVEVYGNAETGHVDKIFHHIAAIPLERRYRIW